jgi:hypothetical protein
MDKGARIRWTVLLSALAVTVAAIVYPIPDPVPAVPSAALPSKSVAPQRASQQAQQQGRGLWIASDDDPFAPRVWQAVTPVTEVAPPPPPPQPAPVQEAPAPPLPYRFIGQMQDDGKRVLYLGRGEQVVLAHQGDVLEDSYKVVSVGETQVEFEFIQSGLRQTLLIPAQ